MEQNEKKRLVGIGISRRGDRKFIIQSSTSVAEEKKGNCSLKPHKQ